MKRGPLEPPDLCLLAWALEEPVAAVAVSVGLLLLLLRRVATALLPGRMPADCCVRPACPHPRRGASTWARGENERTVKKLRACPRQRDPPTAAQAGVAR